MRKCASYTTVPVVLYENGGETHRDGVGNNLSAVLWVVVVGLQNPNLSPLLLFPVTLPETTQNTSLPEKFTNIKQFCYICLNRSVFLLQWLLCFDDLGIAFASNLVASATFVAYLFYFVYLHSKQADMSRNS